MVFPESRTVKHTERVRRLFHDDRASRFRGDTLELVTEPHASQSEPDSKRTLDFDPFARSFHAVTRLTAAGWMVENESSKTGPESFREAATIAGGHCYSTRVQPPGVFQSCSFTITVRDPRGFISNVSESVTVDQRTRTQHLGFSLCDITIRIYPTSAPRFS